MTMPFSQPANFGLTLKASWYQTSVRGRPFFGMKLQRHYFITSVYIYPSDRSETFKCSPQKKNHAKSDQNIILFTKIKRTENPDKSTLSAL